MTDPRIDALKAAITANPSNTALRGLLADLLAQAGHALAALAEYEVAFADGTLTAGQILRAAHIAMDLRSLQVAGRLLHAAAGSEAAPDDLAIARARLVEILAGAVDDLRPSSEEIEALLAHDDGAPELGVLPPRVPEPVRFEEVAGSAEVKEAITRAIILPFQRPDLYETYGRRAGGGVLLFGPPGCGKTLLARATAGECGVPFIAVRTEDILSPYRGESETLLHQTFEHARRQAPCVVFIDEVDALAYSRSRRLGAEGRALVSVLLQELDGFDGGNEGLLVLAASNTPWDVDDALLRPGRFDRRIFVPPPDEAARRHLFAMLLARRPADAVDAGRLAQATDMFSGADIAAAVEWAIDEAIAESLHTDSTTPIAPRHLEAALARVRPSTIDWLLAARNHAEFANADGRYDELTEYLARRTVRKRLG